MVAVGVAVGVAVAVVVTVVVVVAVTVVVVVAVAVVVAMSSYGKSQKLQNLLTRMCTRFVKEKAPKAYALLRAEAQRQITGEVNDAKIPKDGRIRQ